MIIASEDHDEIGELFLCISDMDKTISFLRDAIHPEDIFIKTEWDGRTIRFSVTDIRNVRFADEIHNIETIDEVHNDRIYTCNICENEDEDVSRYTDAEGMIPISAHDHCIREFADTGHKLIQNNKQELTSEYL